jgi:hypothetical protein
MSPGKSCWYLQRFLAGGNLVPSPVAFFTESEIDRLIGHNLGAERWGTALSTIFTPLHGTGIDPCGVIRKRMHAVQDRITDVTLQWSLK